MRDLYHQPYKVGGDPQLEVPLTVGLPTHMRVSENEGYLILGSL